MGILLEKYHEQDVILIMDDGNQISRVMNCSVLLNESRGPNSILYKRTLVADGQNFRLLRYNEKNDVVIYKKIAK